MFYMSYWAKCRPNYYKEDCSVFCQQTQKSHFDCDQITGEKLCHKGWKGENCDQDIKECGSDPCRNSGTCYEPEIGVYRCACSDQYTGFNCEHHVCKVMNPCLNNGTCYNNSECYCSDLYSGKICETHVCDLEPCYNGAVCDRETGSCNCSKAFFGKRCEKDSCKDKNELGHPYLYCLNGECKEGTCICFPGFDGTYCNIPLPASKSSDDENGDSTNLPIGQVEISFCYQL